jgi:hypothetical protein
MRTFSTVVVVEEEVSTVSLVVNGQVILFCAMKSVCRKGEGLSKVL